PHYSSLAVFRSSNEVDAPVASLSSLSPANTTLLYEDTEGANTNKPLQGPLETAVEVSCVLPARSATIPPPRAGYAKPNPQAVEVTRPCPLVFLFTRGKRWRALQTGLQFR
ncbi:unnamed protein product, partial [Ectocarpus sp. 12 AP-2014]